MISAVDVKFYWNIPMCLKQYRVIIYHFWTWSDVHGVNVSEQIRRGGNTDKK